MPTNKNDITITVKFCYFTVYNLPRLLCDCEFRKPNTNANRWFAPSLIKTSISDTTMLSKNQWVLLFGVYMARSKCFFVADYLFGRNWKRPFAGAEIRVVWTKELLEF